GNYTLKIEKEGYKGKTINFTLNEKEFKEIYVYLRPFVYDTFPQNVYLFKNITKDKIIIVFWIKENLDNPEFHLYDKNGREVKRIIFKNLLPGFYRKEINLNLQKGIYFSIFKTKNYKKKSKIIFIK
ncbi:MAG: hypothetical protein ABIM77_07825, partial [candidate division WOR-3 bacterium]